MFTQSPAQGKRGTSLSLGTRASASPGLGRREATLHSCPPPRTAPGGEALACGFVSEREKCWELRLRHREGDFRRGSRVREDTVTRWRSRGICRGGWGAGGVTGPDPGSAVTLTPSDPGLWSKVRFKNFILPPSLFPIVCHPKQLTSARSRQRAQLQADSEKKCRRRWAGPAESV